MENQYTNWIFILIHDTIYHMKQYDFPIVIEQDQDGYFAMCPELQGCYSQGDTYEEVITNIKDAVTLHLQDKLEEKEELPKAKSISLSTIRITL